MAWQKVTSELINVNDATYRDDTVPHTNWKWPQDTWLQQKKRELRELPRKENSWPIKPSSLK